MSILKKELTIEEQQELHSSITGLEFYDLRKDNEGTILYDSDGVEFYAKKENEKYDFSTLEGFFLYVEDSGEKRGSFLAKREIQKALGL